MENSSKPSSTRMRRVDQIQQTETEADNIDTDEAEELEYSTGPFYDKIYKTAEKFAGSYIGQYFTGKVDSLLKLIEDTAKWSLPLKNQNKNEANIPLQRPLPWVPFIALILILRLVRISLSIAGLLIGNAPLVPSDVVYFIQTRRRKLRSIRIAGMKEMRKKEQDHEYNSRSGLLFSLRALLSMALCRPKLCDESHNISVIDNSFVEQKSITAVEEEEQNNKSSKKICSLEDSISDHDLTLNEILDKYGASGNEDEDSDFVPPNDALLDADTSATSSSSSDEDTASEQEREIDDSHLVRAVADKDSTSYIYNGNVSTEISDTSVVSKLNGGYLDSKLKKPKFMPKPLPEIKQEPVDSDDCVKENCIVFERSKNTVNNDIDPFIQQNFGTMSTNIDLHEQQQSIVEKEHQCTASNIVEINESGNDEQERLDVMNGDSVQNCSQPGSPEMVGFQPTSILRNSNEINLQKRGHTEAFARTDRTEELLKAEINSALPSQPAKNTNNTGRSHKNKFRGKRR